MTANPQRPPARPAGEWELFFRNARVLQDKLESAVSKRARSTQMGAFLQRNIDREVTIEHNGQTLRARLRAFPGRSNSMNYAFELTPDAISDPTISTSTGLPGDVAVVTEELISDCSGLATNRPAEPPVELPSNTAADAGSAPRDGVVPAGNSEAW